VENILGVDAVTITSGVRDRREVDENSHTCKVASEKGEIAGRFSNCPLYSWICDVEF
jgi:hypothetical protein